MSEFKKEELSQEDESKTQQQQTLKTITSLYLKYLLWCGIPVLVVLVIVIIIATFVGINLI